MEPINQTSVNCSRYYFIHIGNKNRLHHHPIDQFNGKFSIPSFPKSLIPRQRKLHKEISSILISSHPDECINKSVPTKTVYKEADDALNEDAPITSTADLSSSNLAWDECIVLYVKKSPNLH
jgi:hypothetical protein